MRCLILGIGAAQVDAIKYLKTLGVEVHALSYMHDGPGIAIVDYFEVIDIKDKQAVANYVKDNKITNIYSVGSDLAMPTIGYVAAKLNLPFFVSEDTANLMLDKYAFRCFLKERSFCHSKFQQVKNKSDLNDWNVYPCIIKPVDSQGQRGIYKASKYEELLAYFPDVITHSASGMAIIEEYVEGTEFSVNLFVINSKVAFNFISTRGTTAGSYVGLVSHHILPAKLESDLRTKIILLLSNVVAELGIHNGPVYFQIKIDNGNVFIIEAAPRLDGCHIWRLIKETYGMDLLELSFKYLLSTTQTESISSMLKQNGQNKLEFFLSEPGEIFNDNNFEVKPESIFHEFYYSYGDVVLPVNGKLEKVGYQIYKYD